MVLPPQQGGVAQLTGVLAVAGWLTLLSGAALLLRRRWPEQREWSRKLVHIGAGPVVLIAWAFGVERLIAVPAAGAITLLAALNHRVRVLPAIEDVERRSYGTIAYGASITLLLWLWWPAYPATVAAGVLVMAFGDGLAGLLGPLIPSPSWTVLGERRSLVGTATMGLASLTVLLTLGQLGGGHVPAPAGIVLIALVATGLEQWALFGLDNFSVPMAVAGLWRVLS
ncbi:MULTISPECIES: diacylglycerol/polyprenol kinase family protein [unclassified Cyanobium]|uniref:diacylglycerol/polyprenol kinase family protein n=1 Tax=unclassified Cyanobium TaxID=2627006 RepID=UPI0020CF161B|nr:MULTISPECIES: dolichol kinase [unclassified Cyanobium]MCP9834310.1 dolichol kinase [Cyanobium sp. La Preciosa 7G6]MCP9937054.1 dolichol kinase [Cyanobium sp. Aljojuca 7A6]